MSCTPAAAAAAKRRFSPWLAAACLALACGALLLSSRGCSADSGGLGIDVAGNDAASQADDQGVPSTGPEGTCPMGAAWRSVLHAAALPPNVSASGDDEQSARAAAETESGGEAPAKPCAVQPATSASPLSDDEPRASLAELGRAAWRVVHATAAKVEDSRDLDLFLQYMHSFVAVYPCRLCRTHAWARCGELMSAPTLVGLHAAARRCSPREAAMAWAARLHACVTRNNVADEKAIVSAESRHIADAIEAADEHGTDDAAVVRAVAEAKRAAGPDAQRGAAQ